MSLRYWRIAMIKNEEEIWKAHPYFEKLEVSTLGRVRSVEGHYYTSRKNHNGYLCVSFRVNGKKVGKFVHRLVAETFINNLNSLTQVNHKDCNRENNNVNNLEWCTVSYNAKYREKFGISSTEARGHPVLAINLKTQEVSKFGSQHEASRELGFSQGNINGVIIGNLNQTHGYWFVNDDNNTADAIKQKLHEIKHQTVK